MQPLHTTATDLGTPLRGVAEMSELQEPFPTVRPCTSSLFYIHAAATYLTSMYIKKGKVNFPLQIG